jgi:hypothetical protein
MYHIAADRADKAEGDLKRLQKSYAITNESWQRLKEENALLRKVADAARVLSDIWSVGGKPNLSNLRYALAELNKEGEK